MRLPNQYLIEKWPEYEDYLYCVTDWLASQLSDEEYSDMLPHLEALERLAEKYAPNTIG